jgi:hypothetical protein
MPLNCNRITPLPKITEGVAYFLQGNNKLGCRDVQKAYAMEVYKALESTKNRGQYHSGFFLIGEHKSK